MSSIEILSASDNSPLPPGRYRVTIEPADEQKTGEPSPREAQLLALIADFVDPDECWFDHHGYCQAHGWFETDPKCPHARAKELLSENGDQA